MRKLLIQCNECWATPGCKCFNQCFENMNWSCSRNFDSEFNQQILPFCEIVNFNIRKDLPKILPLIVGKKIGKPNVTHAAALTSNVRMTIFWNV